MKNLKIKLGLFSLFAVFAASVFLTSCEQNLDNTINTIVDIDQQLEEMYADPVFIEVGIAKDRVLNAMSSEGLPYELLSDEQSLPKHILELKLEADNKLNIYLDKYSEFLKLDFSILEKISEREHSLRPANHQINSRCSANYYRCLWRCMWSGTSGCANDCRWWYCDSSGF